MGTFRLGLHETKSGRGRKNGSIGLSGLTGSAEIKKKKKRKEDGWNSKEKIWPKKFQEENLLHFGARKNWNVAVNKFKEEVRLEEGKNEGKDVAARSAINYVLKDRRVDDEEDTPRMLHQRARLFKEVTAIKLAAAESARTAAVVDQVVMFVSRTAERSFTDEGPKE